MNEFFEKEKLYLKPIEKSTAKNFVKKHHYSHSSNLCMVSYGLFQKTNIPSQFFNEIESKLIGVIVYSQPAGRGAAESISTFVKIDECLELIRLVILDGYGKNIESWFISQSFKLLRKDFPNIKVIISYSDTEQNHKGIIYQATNFLFTGLNSDTNLMPNFSVSLTENPYKWIHSRTVFSTYGSHNIEHLKKKIGHTFWRKKEAGKLRYIYILSDKKVKKEILKTFKMKILPYPKNCEYNENIEKFTVEAPIENPFFG